MSKLVLILKASNHDMNLSFGKNTGKISLWVKNEQNKILRVTDGQVNGRSNDMNTILTVQLEDLDDNPPEFEFQEKTRDPLSECADVK